MPTISRSTFRLKTESPYRSSGWTKVSLEHRKNNPLCVCCKEKGETTPAELVDHIIPLSQEGSLLDTNNHQSLCSKCHTYKTRLEKDLRIIYKYCENDSGDLIPLRDKAGMIIPMYTDAELVYNEKSKKRQIGGDFRKK